MNIYVTKSFTPALDEYMHYVKDIFASGILTNTGSCVKGLEEKLRSFLGVENILMKVNTFSEATRVQIPALIHLNRLGYEYIGKINESMAGTIYDEETNILLEVFSAQFQKLNPLYKDQVDTVLKEIKDELDYNNLGRSFFERLQKISPYKLIDYDNIENNTFHYTAEFTCKNGEDSFRPDITLFINGLPLVFLEVKKPNNKKGILAETERLEQRFQNKKFRRFINITQLIILSKY